MKIYTKQDIEIAFTEKVQEYMDMGYRVNVGTMGGSQGEVGKVDLTDGANEIIRIRLERGYIRGTWAEGVTIYVESFGMEVQNGNKFDCFDTLWNGQGEEISKDEFTEIQEGDRWSPVKYITRADWEAEKVQEKRKERMVNGEHDESECRQLRAYDEKVVLGIVRKVDGFKSCKAEDIKGVKCFPVENGHEYKIEIANHRLGAVIVCQEETWAARY